MKNQKAFPIKTVLPMDKLAFLCILVRAARARLAFAIKKIVIKSNFRFYFYYKIKI